MSMKRREFITALGSTVLLPATSRAQGSNVPVIGWLSSVSPRTSGPLVKDFQDGLASQGYVEGRNLWIYYRWAEGHYEDLDALADDLIQQNVRLIAAAGGVISAQAAIKHTSRIPVLFVSGFDPTYLGLVTSLSNPTGNATGVSVYTTELINKRVQIIRELIPSLNSLAILSNPSAPVTKVELEDIGHAAESLDLHVIPLKAGSEQEIVQAFDLAVQQQAGAVIVSADPFFTSRRAQIVELAAQHKLPGCYPWREYAENGGLISYGPDLNWAFRQIGVYAGRILKGAKVSDLPVQMPTGFELTINSTTAKSLDITIPTAILATANRVIE
jgi:putative tryptophan/tyrosine transport system substrate-binding protein